MANGHLPPSLVQVLLDPTCCSCELISASRRDAEAGISKVSSPRRGS